MSSSSDPNPRQSNKQQTDQIKHEADQQQQKQDETQQRVDQNPEEEEEEGECGFCLYMKGGGCKDSFIDWENCIQEAEKNKEDIVEKCFQVTSALRKCMEAHSDYYEPLLRAEKEAEERLEKEMEKEKQEAAAAAAAGGGGQGSQGSENVAIIEAPNQAAEEKLEKEKQEATAATGSQRSIPVVVIGAQNQ